MNSKEVEEKKRLFEKTLEKLDTPAKVQDYLDALGYNHGDTTHSAFKVFLLRKAHCQEGALFAAAALEKQGMPPLLLDLVAVRDTHHVVAVFKAGGKWGAVAKSNYSGLRYREPICETAGELARSYFEDYYNCQGKKTLRSYAVFDLRKSGMEWKYSLKSLRKLDDVLDEQKHFPLLGKKAEKNLRKADWRVVKAGFVGSA